MDESEEWLRGRLAPRNEDGCLLWTGTRRSDGSAHHGFRGRKVRVQRLAYEILVGPVPDNTVVTHLPEAGCKSVLCCNPEHLGLVSPAEHQRRMKNAAAKQRRAARATASPSQCRLGHDLTPDNLCYDRWGRPRCLYCAEANGSPWRNRLQPPTPEENLND